jgi:hypothetical protein
MHKYSLSFFQSDTLSVILLNIFSEKKKKKKKKKERNLVLVCFLIGLLGVAELLLLAIEEVVWPP